MRQWSRVRCDRSSGRAFRGRGKVLIQLKSALGVKTTIAASAPNTGSFAWTVPATLSTAAAANPYTVVVTWLSDTAYTGESGTFTAASPTMGVILPGGGEIWDQGSRQDITWSCGDKNGNVKIELYKGTVLVKVLLASTPNDGVQEIVAPPVPTPGSNYRIKVTWLPNKAIWDFSGKLPSEGFFTVQ